MELGEHWTKTDHLLALIADRLAVANWQRGRDRSIPYPRPMPRPGVTGDKVYGRGAMSVAALRKRFRRRKKG